MKVSKDDFLLLFGFTAEDYDRIIAAGVDTNRGMPDYWGCGLHIRPKDSELNHFIARLHNDDLDSEGLIGKIYYNNEFHGTLHKTRFYLDVELDLQLGEIEITRQQLARLTFKYDRKKDIEGRLLSMLRDHKAVYYHYAVRIEATLTGFKFTGERVGATYSRLYDKDGNEFPIFKCYMMYGTPRNLEFHIATSYKVTIDEAHSVEQVEKVDKLLGK